MDKLTPWSERIKGARDMLVKLKTIGYLQTSDAPKFSKAIGCMFMAISIIVMVVLSILSYILKLL